MKRLEQYIPFAIDVVEDLFLEDDSKVDTEFDNLVSRFGVSVRQLGLKTAVIAFSPPKKSVIERKEPIEKQSPDERKRMITKAILRIIRLHENSFCGENDTLKDHVLKESVNPLLKSKVLDSAVALKLALRLYIENPKPQENEKDINNT